MNKLLVLMLCFIAADRATAQIVYTDVVPDSTVSATAQQVIKSYNIDIDNDGTYEMELRHFNPDPNNIAVELHRNPHSTVTPQVVTDDAGHARVFRQGIVISSSTLYWGQDQYGILNAPWYGGEDKYFGFRFTRRGEWHYGWARVSIPADGSSFTIKDYAYEEMMNAPIPTGGGITGIESPTADDVSIQYTREGHEILLHAPAGRDASITVCDILGRKILNQHCTGELTRIDVSACTRGTYFLTFIDGHLDPRVIKFHL